MVSLLTIIGALSTALSGGGVYLNADMNICAFPFALLGMQGMSRLDVEKLHLYSVYKQIQAIATIINCVLIMFVCGDYCWELSVNGMFMIAFAHYFSYVIWSAEVQLLEGNGLMASYGRQTAASIAVKSPYSVPYSPPVQIQGADSAPIRLTDP